LVSVMEPENVQVVQQQLCPIINVPAKSLEDFASSTNYDLQ